MGTKKTTKQTTNETRTSAPMQMVMPGFEQISQRVTDALGKVPTQNYAGPFVAIPGQDQTQALVDSYTQNAGRASGFGDQVSAAMQQLSNPVTFGMQMPQLSKFAGDDGGARLDAALRASTAPVFKQLMEQVLPSIKSSALESGAYSGDRAMSVMPTSAIDNATRSANEIAAQLAYEGFQQEQARNLSAHTSFQDQLLRAYGLDTERGLGAGDLETRRLSMVPEFAQSAMGLYAGGSDMLRMGYDTEMERQAALVQDALARDSYATSAPFRGLDIATDILTRLSQGYGTQSGQSNSTTVEKTGGLGAVAQGLLGAASLAAGFMGGPIGTAASAAAPVAAGAAGAAQSFSPISALRPQGAASIFMPRTMP